MGPGKLIAIPALSSRRLNFSKQGRAAVFGFLELLQLAIGQDGQYTTIVVRLPRLPDERPAGGLASAAAADDFDDSGAAFGVALDFAMGKREDGSEDKHTPDKLQIEVELPFSRSSPKVI